MSFSAPHARVRTYAYTCMADYKSRRNHVSWLQKRGVFYISRILFQSEKSRKGEREEEEGRRERNPPRVRDVKFFSLFSFDSVNDNLALVMPNSCSLVQIFVLVHYLRY